MQGLPRTFADPNVLVGLDPGDDAAVYRVSDDRAIVFTVDVITPIVDDPFTFGRIAATNSISDIYAMGARPLMALNVACFSPKVPAEAMREILAGASAAASAVGCPILGGHTVKDSEIKFGLAVVGEVHPDQVITLARARVGDVVILTKPIGTAALSTAHKSGRFDESDPLFESLVATLTTMSDRAATIARAHGVTAMTDVTGFGVSGHLAEMAIASGVTIEVEYASLPQLPGAELLLAEGFTCGGGKANGRFSEGKIQLAQGLRAEQIELLHDPQTAGPLAFTVSADRADACVGELRAAGYPRAVRIGKVIEGLGVAVKVV